jgi:hypothetical protein
MRKSRGTKSIIDNIIINNNLINKISDTPVFRESEIDSSRSPLDSILGF